MYEATTREPSEAIEHLVGAGVEQLCRVDSSKSIRVVQGVPKPDVQLAYRRLVHAAHRTRRRHATEIFGVLTETLTLC